MAISSQDIADSLRFALDAGLESDHYGDNEDIIPAIQLSVRWLVNVINRTMGSKKLGEEIFRDLTRARVFELTQDNRLSLPESADEQLWTILAVYPNPVTGNSGLVNDADTPTLREDLYHISSKGSSKRLTIEEWSYNVSNPFEAGTTHNKGCSDLNQSAYLAPFDYNNNSIVNKREIEIRPRPKPNKNGKVLVTVFYVKQPTKITSLGQNDIEFPDSVFDLLFNKALQYIAYKQGDNTTAFTVAQNDIQLLLNTVL